MEDQAGTLERGPEKGSEQGEVREEIGELADGRTIRLFSWSGPWSGPGPGEGT